MTSLFLGVDPGAKSCSVEMEGVYFTIAELVNSQPTWSIRFYQFFNSPMHNYTNPTMETANPF